MTRRTKNVKHTHVPVLPSSSKTASVSTAGKDILDAFRKRRRQLLRMSLLSLGLTLTSLGIVGTQLFYPFHMVIGVSIYILSFIPLVRRIYLGKRTWQTYRAYSFTVTFFRRERRRLVLAVILVCASATFLYLRPLDEQPFVGMSLEEIRSQVADDLYLSVTAMDYLESTGNELLVLLFGVDEKNANATEDITAAFEEFLSAVIFSESLTDRHRYFASIPYRLWSTRVDSFLISYSLYVKKYEIIHRVMATVQGDTYKKKVLNQYMPTVGVSNIYDEMVVRFYAPKTRIRLSGGYYYLQVFLRKQHDPMDERTLLQGKSTASYQYLRSRFITTLFRTGEVVADTAERRMFDRWFPIQKNVAIAMGRTIVSTRGKSGFIMPEQTVVMERYMEPGDIMLQRRNWHVSNVGIPGFWTHTALYTGDIDTMDTFFASEFPHDGYNALSDLLRAEYPEVYAHYQTPDADGNPRTVIEAIEPGVVLQSLAISADADHVVVLRPNIDKRSILLALLKAFSHVGKPYDFNFDFDTRDTLVCSELIYDSYFPRLPEKEGVSFATSIVNGRTIVAPMDMAQKYVDERGSNNAELSFVYFLRGNEQNKTAQVASEREFVESITWSKFSFFQP